MSAVQPTSFMEWWYVNSFAISNNLEMLFQLRLKITFNKSVFF